MRRKHAYFFQKCLHNKKKTAFLKCLRLCVHFGYTSSRSNPPPLLPPPSPRRDAARRRRHRLDFFRFGLRFGGRGRGRFRGDLKSEKRRKARLRFIRRRRLRTTTTTITTTTTEKKRRINTKTRSRRRLWSFPTAIGCPVRGRIGRLSGCPAMRNRTPLARRRHRTRRTTRITITRDRRRRRRRGGASGGGGGGGLSGQQQTQTQTQNRGNNNYGGPGASYSSSSSYGGGGGGYNNNNNNNNSSSSSSSSGRTFVDFSIYKSKSALSVKLVKPTFEDRSSRPDDYETFRRNSLEFAPSIGTRKYDWTRKGSFMLSPIEAAELANRLNPSRQSIAQKVEFFPRPGGWAGVRKGR